MTDKEAIISHIEECKHRISVIQEFVETNKDANVKKCERNTFVLNNAIKTLEKQIPKKPVVTVIENTNCRWVRCSCCNETLVWMYPKPMNYCQNCGTKLDWGNEDAE